MLFSFPQITSLTKAMRLPAKRLPRIQILQYALNSRPPNSSVALAQKRLHNHASILRHTAWP